jgi:protein-S-isoprenylcysteine O-methyltransferase Ste14
MSIFADHSLEFYNLWVLMVLYALPILLTIILRKRVFEPTSSRFASSRSSQEYNLFIVSKILMLIYFLYSTVVPINLDTAIGITGLVIYIVGFAFYSVAWMTIAQAKKGEVFSSGPFRFSRHPVYVSSAIQFIGAGIISQSWLFLGLSLLVGVSHMRNAIVEEQICLEIFGDEYRQYMVSTPRWLGWPARKPSGYK